MLPGTNSCFGVLADVYVEESVIGNMVGVAQLWTTGQQEAGIAIGLRRSYPEETLVDLGIGDVWVDAFEIHTDATVVEASGGPKGIQGPGERVGDGEGMKGRIVVASGDGIVGDEAASSEGIGAGADGLVLVGLHFVANEISSDQLVAELKVIVEKVVQQAGGVDGALTVASDDNGATLIVMS